METKNEGGRPSDFTQELADEICERICTGESVRQIADLEHMPSRQTIYRWLLKNEGFRDQYARAKEFQSDYHAEEILDIADDGTNDWEEREFKNGKGTYIALNDEAIARSRLRVEARKWLMGKMKPKKYGDHLDLTTKGEKLGLSEKTDEELLAIINLAKSIDKKDEQ